MKELYEQLGISSQVYDFCHEIEESLKERFEQFDKTAEYNQMKVLLAMQRNASGLPLDMVTMTMVVIHWKRSMQTHSIQKPVWCVHRLHAGLMLWLLLFLEIFVLVMKCLHLQENLMILWKR